MSTTLATPNAGTVLNPPTVANTVLADLQQAIETYPQTYLTVEIFSVDPAGTGSAINEGDDVTFRVRVHNSGPLHVDDLTVLVESEPGADGVRQHADTAFDDSLTSAVFPRVPAHQQDGTWIETPDDHYHFKAGSSTKNVVDLVKVSINTWNANLDHLLEAHSDPVPEANDVFSAKVVRI
jgi:hypothetical protein